MLRSTVRTFLAASVVVNLIVVLVVFVSCGGRNGYTDGGDEQGPPPGEDGGEEYGWDDAAVDLKAACGKCHDGAGQKAFDSKARLFSSKALARIENGTMPPGGGGDAGAKSRLVAYLKAGQ